MFLAGNPNFSYGYVNKAVSFSQFLANCLFLEMVGFLSCVVKPLGF